MTRQQEDELIAFISSSSERRQMTFLELSRTLFDGQFGVDTIRGTLNRRGYRRYPAVRKPFISEENHCKRLQFAYNHLNWTAAQWAEIFWTDETWVAGRRHRKTWITRRIDEAYNPTCVARKERRWGGWMFWGSFTGITQGPGLFWEKE